MLPRQDAREAFTSLFSAEYPRMVRTVYLVVHDLGHAEEITQDAFEQLLDHWETVSGYEQPAAWVRRVAIRMAVRAGKRGADAIAARAQVTREHGRARPGRRDE